MCFMPVTDPKTVKNRVHLDHTSSAADRDQEIDRLLTPGARRAGVGQAGAESRTVLADPEGKRVLRRAPEGNAHPMRLSTGSRRQTLSGRVGRAHCCARPPSEPDVHVSVHPAQASPEGSLTGRSAGLLLVRV